MPKVINMDEFNNEVVNAKGVAVIDFYADWCGPCKMLAPIFQELSSEFEGKAKFFKVDIDKSLDLARQYSVNSVPTMLVFKDGNLVETLIGFMPKENIAAKVNQYI